MADPIYIEDADLARYGLPQKVVDSLPQATRDAARAAASRRADGYFPSQFTLPLVAPFPEDLKQAVGAIAAWDLMAIRGFNPGLAADEVLRLRFEDAIKWLEGVARGLITPRVLDSSSGAAVGVPSAGPRVYSSSQRGWTAIGGGGGPFTGD